MFYTSISMKIYSTTFNYTQTFKGSSNSNPKPSNNTVAGFSKVALQIPISMGWRSIFGNFGDNRYDTLSKQYPEAAKLLDNAKSIDATGSECDRFDKQGKSDILEKINIAKHNGRDCQKILQTMLDQKEYGDNFSLIQRFSKIDICNVLDSYATNSPNLVEKIVMAENNNKYAESLYLFKSGDIKNVVNIINRNPYLPDAIVKAKHIPSKMGLSSLAADINGEKLQPEQINVAIELMNTKNKNGDKILEEDWQFNDNAKRVILNTTKKEIPIITDLCNNSNISFDVSANLAKGLYGKDPKQIKTIKTLLAKDIKIDNYAQAEPFLNMPENKQEKIISDIDKNQEFVSNNDINVAALDHELAAKINYMKNERYYVTIANQYRDLLFSENHVPLSAVKNGISVVKSIPQEISGFNPTIMKNALTLGVYNNLGYVSDSFTKEYTDTLKKLSEFDDDAVERLNNVIVYNFDDVLSNGNIGTLSKNIDYFKNKDLSGYSYQQLENILFSNNENLKENKEKLDNLFNENEEKIFNSLRQKCSNIPPDYGENVLSMFQRDKDFEQLILLPKISKDEIVNNAVETEKLIYNVLDNPKKYLNGNYSEKVLNIVSSDLKHIPIIIKTQITQEDGVQIDEAKECINECIFNNLPAITNAIAITDADTVNMLLDKRLIDFSKEVNDLQKLSPKNKKLLSNIIKNGRIINQEGFIDKLTNAQKLDMINIIKVKDALNTQNQTDFDFNKYFYNLSDSEFIIDTEKMNNDIIAYALSKNGIDNKTFNKLNKENINWDISNIGLFSNHISEDKSKVCDVIREASLGNFDEFITDTSNKYGKANQKTKQEFENNNLNFNNWDNSTEGRKFTINGQSYTVNKWTRTPQQSLMDGNYTDSNTALNKRYGSSMADYLLNKAINIIEVKDNNNKIVGIAGCYVGNVNGKQSIIIDSMDVNNNFQKHLIQNHAEKEYAENVIDYIQDLADSVGGLHMPIYMSTDYTGLDNDITKDYKKIDANLSLTGEIANDKIYMNLFKKEVNPKTISSRNAELYIVRN